MRSNIQKMQHNRKLICSPIGRNCFFVVFFFFFAKFSLLNFLLLGLPILTSTPPSLATPKELSTFRQTCQALGFPPPVINWTRSGMDLPVGKTEVNDGTLTITSLSPADSGLYECVATNSMGTKKTKMNVAVQKYLKGVCY